MMIIVPEKLKSGSHVRVIAPSRSLGIISEDCRRIAESGGLPLKEVIRDAAARFGNGGA